jgi:hypothetical protein
MPWQRPPENNKFIPYGKTASVTDRHPYEYNSATITDKILFVKNIPGMMNEPGF